MHTTFQLGITVVPPFLDDASVAQRVLDHIDRGTTDKSDEMWREPVANYLLPERFDRECRLLRSLLVPFCPSAALPRCGSHVAREAVGTPLLAVRDEHGVARVFRNACRHRGMALAKGSGCAKALVCRYHGWTYHLDGRLRHMPGMDGFPDLDLATHGLVLVHSEEKLGLVWVNQQAPTSGVRSESLALDGLPELVHPEQTIMEVTMVDLDANWKLFLESFLEGYHIRATHPQTFYPYGFDNLNLLETNGPHSRITFPFRRIKQLADVPSADRRVKGLVTFVYHLFPNVLVSILSHHSVVVVLEPLTVDRTRMVSYVLSDRGDEPAALEASYRDVKFVSETGAVEDREVVCAIQRGLKSGANEHFTFGGFERLIAHFHRQLTSSLAECI
jgi:phenylpropionate dioxygenase-like ring-hydroxylating dioxygenase large terminal subunit